MDRKANLCLLSYKELIRFLVLVSLLLSGMSAEAQYVVVDLDSSAYQGTFGQAISGNVQVGKAYLNDQTQAVLWNNTAASIVNLNPAGFPSSWAYGASGNFEVGWGTYSSGVTNALLWTGSSNVPVNLAPSTTTSSWAFAISGTQEVGQFAGLACLWSGTAASKASLNPSGSTQGSIAYGTSGTHQVGYAIYSGVAHAMLWSGTAASAVDLSGGVSSTAYAISGTTEVGYKDNHAYLWNGTNLNGVDLHPSGFQQSQATAISGSVIVGYAIDSSVNAYAYMWKGTAASAVDLSKFLPASTTYSQATGVDSNGNIIGFGFDSAGSHAYLWTPTVAPTFNSVAQSAMVSVGLSYSFNFTASGNPPPTFSYSGTLPTSLNFTSAGALSGTPSQTGNFTGTVTATNGVGSPATQNFSITVYPTYSSWTAQEGLTGDNAQPSAIISPDGLTNQFKYALGLDPFTTYNPGDPALPVVKTTNVSASTYLTLTFNGVATDVTYTVQATNDPTLPSTSWTQLYSYKGTPPPGTVTVQDTQPESPDEPKRFLHLMISP